MFIVDHPVWPELQRYVRMTPYPPDTGPDGGPRVRFDLYTPESGERLRRFAAITLSCPTCGKVFHPVRPREGGGNYYIASSCEDNKRCARCRPARAAYDAMEASMRGWRDPRQPGLFE